MTGNLTSFARGLLLCGLCVSPALAYDPRLPVLGGESGAQVKIEAFSRLHAEDEAATQALAQAAEKGVAERDRIHRALLASHEGYAKAYRGYAESGQNVEDWQALLTGLDDGPATRHLRAHATYFLARCFLARDDLEFAAAALEDVRGRLEQGSTWVDEATFYLGYVYGRLPDRQVEGLPGADVRRAQRLLATLLSPEQREQFGISESVASSFSDVPERFREDALWIYRELRGEGMGPLLELAKRMEAIESMIDRARTGQPTQKKQEEVVMILDKLIELMREKEQSGGGGGGGGGGQGGQSGPAGGAPNGPAQSSTLPGGSGGIGNLQEGNRSANSESWGNLRDKEREQAEQFLREKFPSRYKEIIERYYRAIAEKDK